MADAKTVEPVDQMPGLVERMEAICTRLETKTAEDVKAQVERSAKLTAILPDVRAALEEISNSADVVAHTRGPLARKVLDLLKDF